MLPTGAKSPREHPEQPLIPIAITEAMTIDGKRGHQPLGATKYVVPGTVNVPQPLQERTLIKEPTG